MRLELAEVLYDQNYSRNSHTIHQKLVPEQTKKWNDIFEYLRYVDISLKKRVKVDKPEDKRSNEAPEEIYCHVIEYGIYQLPRFHVNEREKATQSKGIEKLEEVAVEKSEEGGRYYYSVAFSHGKKLFAHDASEKQLLKYRGENYHENECRPQRHTVDHLLNGIFHYIATQGLEKGEYYLTYIITAKHERDADTETAEPFSRSHFCL